MKVDTSRTVTLVFAPGHADPPEHTAAVSWLPAATLHGMTASSGLIPVLARSNCDGATWPQFVRSPIWMAYRRSSAALLATSHFARSAKRVEVELLVSFWVSGMTAIEKVGSMPPRAR